MQFGRTQMLIDAEPTGTKEPAPTTAPLVLDARNVEVTFALKKTIFGKATHVLRAVDGVSLAVRAGPGRSGVAQKRSFRPAAWACRASARNLHPSPSGIRPSPRQRKWAA